MNYDYDEESRTAQGPSYRNEHGHWVELSPEGASSGDPETDELRDLPLSEFQEIRQDSSHPLHEKTKQVSAELRPRIQVQRFLVAHPSILRSAINSRLPAYNLLSEIGSPGQVMAENMVVFRRKITGLFTPNLFAPIRDALQQKMPPN